jgi:hypothetical protein
VRRIAIYIIAALVVLIAIPVVASLGEYTRAKTALHDDSRFIRELSVIALTADAFGMAEVTDFDWDTLYIFGPYTTWREMEEQVGRAWYESYADYLIRRTPIGRHPVDDDSLQKLVFAWTGASCWMQRSVEVSSISRNWTKPGSAAKKRSLICSAKTGGRQRYGARLPHRRDKRRIGMQARMRRYCHVCSLSGSRTGFGGRGRFFRKRGAT